MISDMVDGTNPETTISAAVGRAAGLRVLSAGPGAVGVGVPFDVVTELFAPLAELPADDDLFAGAAAVAWAVITGREVPTADEERDRTVHAMHWLVRRLAGRGPVALIVDDLDVADEASVRCLEYVATRSGGLPLLVVATVTSQARGRPAEVRAVLSDLPGATVVRLRPLRAPDLVPLLDRRGLTPSDAAFREACVDLAGGDAALVRDLLDAVAAEALPPRAASLTALAELPAPASTIRTVGARLRRLPPVAAVVADAVHVLGDDATVPRVARIAAMTDDAVRDAIDALAAAALVTPTDTPRLRSPLVQQALAAAPASERRGRLRSRAAELLRHEDVPLERVAAQVHGAGPGTAVGAVETLMAAARKALAAGRLGAAEEHLRRILVEPTTAGVEEEVRLMLLCTQRALGRDGADDRFEALLTGRPPALRARALHRSGTTLVAAGRRRTAAETFRRALAELDGASDADTLRMELEAAFVAVGRDLPGVAADAQEVLARHLDGAMPAPMAVLAAVDGAYRGRPRAEVAARARAALDAILRDGAAAEDAVRCVAVLLWCDELDLAQDGSQLLVTGGVADATDLRPAHAWGQLLQGRLAEAVSIAAPIAEGRGGSSAAAPAGTVAAAVTVAALLELGELDRAAAILDAALDEDAARREERGLDVHLLEARGLLALRAGTADAAGRTFARALELAGSAGMDNPAVVRSWFGAVRACTRVGRVDEARELAREALERARRFGAPRTEAVALVTAASVAASRPDAAAMLERALELLDARRAPLDRARALLAYGGLLTSDNRRALAREPLREALDLAYRVGAPGLEARVLAELRAAGARPRRVQSQGVASLTPAERQVAEHAGRGLSNREIAEILYVTPKTVEWHLRNVFLKLGVGDRRQLGAVLAGRPVPERPAGRAGRRSPVR